MHRRSNPRGSLLASLLLALGLLVQGLAASQAVTLPAGICHAGPADPNQPPADQHDHAACCLLCHANPALAAASAAQPPAPAIAAATARPAPEPAPSAPFPAAFYVARAPPRA